MQAAEKGLLLLCCKLGQAVKPLTAAEYRQLSEYVRIRSLTGTQQDTEVRREQLMSLGCSLEMSNRVAGLLDREKALREYLYKAENTAVLTRISEGFPRRLYRLEDDCPATLFCKGDLSLLNSRCISLVGSRLLFPRGRDFARRIGRMAAREGFTLVSGGASGADTAAQEACLAAGGTVICFVPDELSRYAPRKNLLYCSADGYDLSFSASRALRRNHFIHALGEKVFVAQCPGTSGGTWAGTSDNLRHRWSEVYVLSDGSDGAEALMALGAVGVDENLPPLADLLSYQLSIFD